MRPRTVSGHASATGASTSITRRRDGRDRTSHAPESTALAAPTTAPALEQSGVRPGTTTRSVAVAQTRPRRERRLRRQWMRRTPATELLTRESPGLVGVGVGVQ